MQEMNPVANINMGCASPEIPHPVVSTSSSTHRALSAPLALVYQARRLFPFLGDAYFTLRLHRPRRYRRHSRGPAPEPAVVARRIPFESFNSFGTGGNGGGSKSGDGGISIGTLTRRLQIRACILI